MYTCFDTSIYLKWIHTPLFNELVIRVVRKYDELRKVIGMSSQYLVILRQCHNHILIISNQNAWPIDIVAVVLIID